MFVFQEEDHVFKEYTTPLLIGGLWTEVHKKTLKKEIGSLQTRFQELRPNLKQLSDPKGTLVISRPAEPDGSFAYFIGELTDTAEQDSSFAVESLACGPYAHISVSFQDPTELTLAVARAKQFFFEKWLPTSGYSVQPDIESGKQVHACFPYLYAHSAQVLSREVRRQPSQRESA